MKNLFENFYKKTSIAVATLMIIGVTSTTANGATENKSSRFSSVVSESGAQTSTDRSDDAKRAAIERQMAAADARDRAESSAKTAGANGATTCDSGLRKCMSEKCGANFSKCATDGEAVWNGKMDACRKKTNCSAHEYTELAPQIKLDRDANVRMASYQSIIDCGNDYNACIFSNCGKSFENCLSKADGDKVISKCDSIARECKTYDSGLASRAMSAFGDNRKIATNTAKRDENRLVELRDLMRAQCNRLGAMFDDRTLDCVYTVNFYAGDDASTPTASKKLYAGDAFQCTPNWFGIDVTTYKENAYRLTRSQTSASSAALGAGVGTAMGMISSGAINRAIDRTKAEKAVKDAEKETEEKEEETEEESKEEKPKKNEKNRKNTNNNVDTDTSTASQTTGTEGDDDNKKNKKDNIFTKIKSKAEQNKIERINKKTMNKLTESALHNNNVQEYKPIEVEDEEIIDEDAEALIEQVTEQRNTFNQAVNNFVNSKLTQNNKNNILQPARDAGIDTNKQLY